MGELSAPGRRAARRGVQRRRGRAWHFKDRVLLTSYFDLVCEGMAVRGLRNRREPRLHLPARRVSLLLESLQELLARRRAQGLLGRSICGGKVSILTSRSTSAPARMSAARHLPWWSRWKASAAFRATGRRAWPRRVTSASDDREQRGTYCIAALILLHGAEWFRSYGTAQSSGTKLISVSGDCERPGVYEYPLGVTVRQVLDDCGAGRTIAVQCGDHRERASTRTNSIVASHSKTSSPAGVHGLQ